MDLLKRIFFISLFLTISIGIAKSDLLVPHAQLCKNNVVQKFELYKVLVASQPISENLKVSAYPDWRRIPTNPGYCDPNPRPVACQDGDAEALGKMKVSFKSFKLSGAQTGSYIPTNSNVTMEQYFVGADGVNAIKCGSADVPVPVKSAPDTSRVRLRGISDDLYVDRSWNEFKGTSQASVNFSNDNSATHVTSTKIKATLGYAFDIDTPGQILSTFIPFISADEAITDTAHKPRSLPASNNVASGFSLNANIGGNAMFSIKPQFIVGTTMHSQLTMVQVSYAPWTNKSDSGYFMPFNTAVPVYGSGNDSSDIWGQFLFDLRADLGSYNDRGDPMFVAQNQDFARFGSKFGFAFFTAPGAIPVTLRATEVLLYGAQGAQRNIGYFDSSLSVGLDRNGYASWTLGYTNGRDENTTVRVQTFKAGLSARY